MLSLCQQYKVKKKTFYKYYGKNGLNPKAFCNSNSWEEKNKIKKSPTASSKRERREREQKDTAV